MRNVVSFCEARAARLKQSLSALAARREGAVVKGRGGEPICARRIFWRDLGVVLIDRYGFQRRLGYDDILDAIPLESIVTNTSTSMVQPKEKALMSMEDRTGAGNVIASSNVIAFQRRGG